MTEQGPGDFKEFVRLRSDKMLRFAFWMTGTGRTPRTPCRNRWPRPFLVWARIEQPDAYVHRLVANSVRSRYRTRRREILVADPPDSGTGDSGMEALSARTVLAGALRRLPRRQRAVVVLRCCLDLPVAEVASLLHCSTGTVKSQLSKGLAKLGQDPELGGMR